MGDVFSMLVPVQRAFAYDPADGAELVTSKVAMLINNVYPAPTDVAIDENGDLSFSSFYGGTIVASPGDFISSPGNGYIVNDGPVPAPPYTSYGYAMVGPYTIPGYTPPDT